jgi:hypothetical protein
MFAAELERTVADERARQQAGFAQNLETVADAQHHSAAVGEFAYRFHYRGKLRYRAGAQIVAEGEAARDDNRITILQVVGFVPQKSGWLPGNVVQSPIRVVIAVRSGEDDDAKFHRGIPLKGLHLEFNMEKKKTACVLWGRAGSQLLVLCSKRVFRKW